MSPQTDVLELACPNVVVYLFIDASLLENIHLRYGVFQSIMERGMLIMCVQCLRRTPDFLKVDSTIHHGPAFLLLTFL